MNGPRILGFGEALEPRLSSTSAIRRVRREAALSGEHSVSVCKFDSVDVDI